MRCTICCPSRGAWRWRRRGGAAMLARHQAKHVLESRPADGKSPGGRGTIRLVSQARWANAIGHVLTGRLSRGRVAPRSRSKTSPQAIERELDELVRRRRTDEGA